MEKFNIFCGLVLIFTWTQQGLCIRIVSQPILERPASLIDLTLKTQYAVEGSNYKMKCKVNGEAIILWKVDGGFPDEPKYKILPDFNLLIRNVSQEDYKKEYICSAVVPKFMTVESMRIELQPRREGKVLELKETGNNRISNELKPTKVYAVLGEYKTLSCSVNARPYPEFKWLYHNGTFIKNGTDLIITSLEDTSNLTIFVRNDEFFGDFICESWNRIGRTKQSFSLVMPEKPTEIPFIFPKNIGGTKITLGVNYDTSKNYSVQVQYKSTADSDNQGWKQVSGVSEDLINLENLQPNTTYLIQAAVKNNFILGDYSQAIRVTTDKLNSFSDDENRIGRGRSLNINGMSEEGDIQVINSTVWTSTKMVKSGQKIIITRTTVEEMDDQV